MRRDDMIYWAVAIIAILLMAAFIYNVANTIDLPVHE